MILFIVLVAISILTAGMEVTCCKCKDRYVLVTDIKTNWHNANNYCARNGMQLAQVYSPEDMRLLMDTVLKIPYEKRLNHWLGANDLAKEGEFVWTATGIPLNYTYWSNGQPDNWTPNGEHCLMMYMSIFEWNDLSCSMDLNFVCENMRKKRCRLA